MTRGALSPAQAEAAADGMAYDHLPPELRRLLGELLVKASSIQALGIYRREFGQARQCGNPDPGRYAVRRTIAILTAFEDGLLEPGPHLAAAATIQRYHADNGYQRHRPKPLPRAVLRLAPEIRETA